MKKILNINMRCLVSIFVLFVTLCFSPQSLQARDQLTIHFLSVGYGDAILIQLPSKEVILVDAGTDESGPKISDYLSALKIKAIDLAIITHPHKNHFGGFTNLIDTIPIKTVWVNGDPRADDGYIEQLNQLRAQGAQINQVSTGERFVRFRPAFQLDVLNGYTKNKGVNESSIALLLTFGQTRFFLMSDIGVSQQKQIFFNYPGIKQADYIQVPHHGDKLDKKLINVFQNRTFIVSTGKNTYGLPYEEALSKLKGKVLRTDIDGNIILTTDGKEITLETYPDEVFQE